MNPGGSSKDRVAKGIVEDAERRGLLPAGGTIVEGTSGSTGISLSLMARGNEIGTISRCSMWIRWLKYFVWTTSQAIQLHHRHA